MKPITTAMAALAHSAIILLYVSDPWATTPVGIGILFVIVALSLMGWFIAGAAVGIEIGKQSSTRWYDDIRAEHERQVRRNMAKRD